VRRFAESANFIHNAYQIREPPLSALLSLQFSRPFQTGRGTRASISRFGARKGDPDRAAPFSLTHGRPRVTEHLHAGR
jgi:hypothetical protein